MSKHVILLLAGMVLIGACAGSYGKLVTSHVSEDQYRQQTLPADLDYYYCGRSGLPYAVVGIDDTYRFNDRFWFKIQSMDEVYEKIYNLSDLHPYARSMRAADILDPAGKRIGVWFSYYHHTPVKVDPDSGVLDIFNPYDPDEDKGLIRD
ncbi:MAG: hypothetical protein U5K27_10730 [Desulfotignum sp.]|nr:hypothetical protein [Desulfotignum sp.]